jgi:signal transduction histidine kinase
MFNKVISFLKTTRFKITLWYTGIFLILEVVMGIAIYLYVSNSMNNELNNSLLYQAEMIDTFVKGKDTTLLEFKPDSSYETQEDFIYDLIFDALMLNPRNTFIQVKLNDKIVFKTENLRKKELEIPKRKKPGKEILNITDENLTPNRIRVAHLRQDPYDISVAFSTGFIDATLKSLTNIYIIIAPIFFAISFLGGALISAKSLSRIDKIIRKTEDITTQNLNEIIVGEESGDEYGRLTQKMNDMIRRLRTSIEYMNQFSISASHELKTPLTILRGEIEIALKSTKTPEQYREVLKSNYEETLRLINIVDKMFFISRAENTQVKLNKTKISLYDFLDEIIKRSESLGKEKNVQIILKCEKDIEIEIDTTLMKQAIVNLIENAVKYGEENEPIYVEAEILKNNSAKISVINKGEGISEENLEKIFERFYRSKTSKTAGGIGLGLSIVKSIVNWHNGEITVKSKQGDQTEFSIII